MSNDQGDQQQPLNLSQVADTSAMVSSELPGIAEHAAAGRDPVSAEPATPTGPSPNAAAQAQAVFDASQTKDVKDFTGPGSFAGPSPNAAAQAQDVFSASQSRDQENFSALGTTPSSDTSTAPTLPGIAEHAAVGRDPESSTETWSGNPNETQLAPTPVSPTLPGIAEHAAAGRDPVSAEPATPTGPSPNAAAQAQAVFDASQTKDVKDFTGPGSFAGPSPNAAAQAQDVFSASQSRDQENFSALGTTPSSDTSTAPTLPGIAEHAAVGRDPVASETTWGSGNETTLNPGVAPSPAISVPPTGEYRPGLASAPPAPGPTTIAPTDLAATSSQIATNNAKSEDMLSTAPTLPPSTTDTTPPAPFGGLSSAADFHHYGQE